MTPDFDVVVIGGGHAGAEATRVAARAGLRTAMVTMDRNAIGRMSCNPAIGGLAKGNLVKEIDALGGLMAEATDAAGIQYKVLNRSKGPAVQGPRAQCDRNLYAEAVQKILAAEPNVAILEGIVGAIELDHQRITGISLEDGSRIRCRAVVVTTGTFLRALMHSGEVQKAGGRFGEAPATTLSDSLAALGLRLGRLKTGTPPRILRDTVDFSRLEQDAGDPSPRPFSILTDRISRQQVMCHLTYTGEPAHDLIRANLHRAPMYSGQIDATGPRYCPSIEDKVVRFSDKDRHHVFVEPEGLDHPWLYLNGISTSLPSDVQDGVVRSLPGFDKAQIARYGYAVEYDFVNPEQLESSLQVRGIEGLFLAGQINGTSGYEEAAAQGLVAGLNVVQALRGKEPFVLRRDEAYTGVMIDDLVTLGTVEPYRMFTSRAEYRLLLGCDSAYERLTPRTEALGVLDETRLQRAHERVERMARVRGEMLGTTIVPDRETTAWFAELGLELNSPTTMAKLLQRPGFNLARFRVEAGRHDRFETLIGAINGLRGEEELEGVISQSRYAGYIEKQRREAEKLREDEGLVIPEGFDYERPGLSREVSEKLTFVRPRSLGQAARVRGVTPAAVAILRMHLRRGRRGSDDERRRAPAAAV